MARCCEWVDPTALSARGCFGGDEMRSTVVATVFRPLAFMLCIVGLAIVVSGVWTAYYAGTSTVFAWCLVAIGALVALLNAFATAMRREVVCFSDQRPINMRVSHYLFQRFAYPATALCTSLACAALATSMFVPDVANALRGSSGTSAPAATSLFDALVGLHVGAYLLWAISAAQVRVANT